MCNDVSEREFCESRTVCKDDDRHSRAPLARVFCVCVECVPPFCGLSIYADKLLVQLSRGLIDFTLSIRVQV